MRHEPPPNVTRVTLEYESSLESGFQIATLQGPLCAEPVQGMAFVLESLKGNGAEQQEADSMSFFLVISSSHFSIWISDI